MALFESLMRQIHNLQLTYSNSTLREQNQNAFRLMCSALKLSAKDLQDLRKRLAALIQKSDPSATRIWRRIRYTFKEGDIKRLADRLDIHIARFNTVLTLIGRYIAYNSATWAIGSTDKC